MTFCSFFAVRPLPQADNLASRPFSTRPLHSARTPPPTLLFASDSPDSTVKAALPHRAPSSRRGPFSASLPRRASFSSSDTNPQLESEPRPRLLIAAIRLSPVQECRRPSQASLIPSVAVADPPCLTVQHLRLL
ncbi:uncharacterized protein DS421_3g61090 [Arachis hypogaea]|nr:uncharacterized protein DS421_3g61090 [Arachis hypogaea]